MRKINLFSIFLVITVLLIGCNSVKKIDNTNMDEVISDHIITYTYYKPTEKEFEAHKIYGTNKEGNKIKVYMYFAVIGYSSANGGFKAETGGHGAILIELLLKNGEYEVTKFKEALQDEIVKDIFPKEYADKALNENPTDLFQSIEEQAESWLKSKGRTEKIINFGPQ